MVRAWANVSMICATIVLDKEKYNLDQPESIPRDKLICKITYVAQGKHIYIFYFLNIYIYIYSSI